MNNRRSSALRIAQGAAIAALYVVLTLIFAPISFGEMQVRISEALTILPLFTPAAIPGLFVGCVLANILGGAIVWDVVFGSLATLIGAAAGYLLRRNRWLVPLPTVLANAIIVPFVLKYTYGFAGSIWYFALTVGAGQIIACGILGGILLGAYLLLNFDKDLVVPAIVAIIFAVLMIICLERPGIVGVKPDYPVNCVEEVIALVLFPVRVLIALLTLLIGVAAVGGIVYGILLWFDEGLAAAIVFGATALVPFVVPLIVYFIYLDVMFTLDFYKAIVSIPRKLDELKK